MDLKTLVKVSINNLSDARYCAGMGVQFLGFNLTKDTPGYLTNEAYQEIVEWLEGPKNIGEFTNSDSQTIEAALKAYEVDGIQLDEQCDMSVASHFDGIKIMKINFSESISAIEEAIAKHPVFDYYLIDSEHKISLKPQAFLSLKELTANHKILLGVGLQLDSLDEIIENSGIAGIHLKGGNEERPGWVDIDELADYLEFLEVEI